MKRLTLLVLCGLLGVVSTGLGYDGPSPQTYDHTISGIRVVLTSQGAIRPDGNARFTMTASVPITEYGPGTQVTLQVWKANPTGPQNDLVADCVYVPKLADVGRTIQIPCNPFYTVPYAQWEATSMAIYPRVVQQLKTAPDVVHDGRAFALTAAVVWDDRFEENDQFDPANVPGSARMLGDAPFIRLDDLVSNDPDFFLFTVPPGMEVTQVRIEFWNGASDLDLAVFDDGGRVVGVSSSIEDEETVTVPVRPGATYFVLVDNYSGLPAFYDLLIAHKPADAVTMLWGPVGNPNPVAPGQPVALAALATGWPNEVPTYQWSVECPMLPANGTLDDPTSSHPVWTAPANDTLFQQNCTVRVTATSGARSDSASYTQVVDPSADYLTLVSPPKGLPDPVQSGGTIQLSVEVTDSLAHPVFFEWQADCGELGEPSFAPGPFVQSPALSVPHNDGTAPRGCVISVRASDAYGHSVSDSYYHPVMNRADTVSVRLDERTPNPVASRGIVTLSASGTDTFGHALTFTWSAQCTTLPANGTFPSGNVGRSVTWQAPQNLTAESKICRIEATASDGLGASASSAYAQRVEPENTITITQGPSASPDPVFSGGVVTLRVGATDVFGRSLSFLWQAICPTLPTAGQLSNASSALTTWAAPANASGAPALCTFVVAVDDGRGSSRTASVSVTVARAPQVVGTPLTSGDTPNAVKPLSGVQLGVSGTDGLSLSYLWTAACEGLPDNGSFDIPTSATPVWTAPLNETGSPRTCTLSVRLTDDSGQVQTASFVVVVEPAAARQTGHTYYLAEGATVRGFFETRLALLNLDATGAADVTIEFHIKDTGRVLTYRLAVGARQRATVDVSTLPGADPSLTELASAEFSITIHSTLPLVVDRTMRWDDRNYGAHSETAVSSPSSTWYLAEGATLGNFELYYLIQNPNDTPLENEIEVTYLLPPPRAPIVRRYSMGARTRRNIVVHEEPGLEDVELSAIVRTPSGKPVIVERAMYLSSPGLPFSAGHASAGIPEPRTTWFFAEGATGPFFDLFVLIANPNDAPARVSATYLFRDGTTCTAPVGSMMHAGTLAVGPKSRHNIWVNREIVPGCPRDLASGSMSVTINSDLPVVAERTMWWPGPTADTWAEAHNSPGATAPGTFWAMADAEEGGDAGIETYLLIANTSDYDGVATVTLHFEDGSTQQKNVELLKNSRTNVPVGAPRDDARRQLGQAEADGSGFGGVAAGLRFGVTVESLPVAGQAGPARIVVERSTYWDGPGGERWAAGVNALAVKVR